MKRNLSTHRPGSEHRSQPTVAAPSPRGPRASKGSESLRVLIVGAAAGSHEHVAMFERLGWDVTVTSDPASISRARSFDLVFIDRRADADGRRALARKVRARWPGAPIAPVGGRPGGTEPKSPLRPTEPPLSGAAVRTGASVPPEARAGPSPALPGSPNPPRDLGTGRLEPADLTGDLSEDRDQKVLRIDTNGATPRLLGRLLVGGYITGQDRIVLTASRDLTVGQREEVQRAAHRVLGMSVVTDRPGRMEVQSFLDPAKYAFVPLLNRTVWMLQAQLELCRRALDGTDQDFLSDVEEVEEGIDRLYLLMVRQLLLSCENPGLARRIDVGSRHFQIGDRLVAKMLEVIGDLIHEVGRGLAAGREGFQTLPPDISRELSDMILRFESFLKRTAETFLRTSASAANALLDEIQTEIPSDSSLGDELTRRIADPKLAVAAGRVVWGLVLAFDMLVVMNEITINRSVEPVSGGGNGATLRFPEPVRPGS